MKLINIKKLAAVAALGLTVVLGTSLAANAQGNRNNDHHNNDQKQVQKANQQQDKWEQQRNRDQQDRNRIEQQRPNIPASTTRQVGGGFYNVHPNPVVNNNVNRYRVFRNGSYYNTDNRGADLLRQAVNAGYQQGFAAGQSDHNARHGSNWGNSSVYRHGTYGWQSYVDRGQYQYYFQQGFERGYQDGYNSRYQYGFNNGGSVSILSSILGSILNIQNY